MLQQKLQSNYVQIIDRVEKQEQRLVELQEELRAQGIRHQSAFEHKVADGSMDTSFLNTLSNVSITRDANHQSLSRASDK